MAPCNCKAAFGRPASCPCVHHAKNISKIGLPADTKEFLRVHRVCDHFLCHTTAAATLSQACTCFKSDIAHTRCINLRWSCHVASWFGACAAVDYTCTFTCMMRSGTGNTCVLAAACIQTTSSKAASLSSAVITKMPWNTVCQQRQITQAAFQNISFTHLLGWYRKGLKPFVPH